MSRELNWFGWSVDTIAAVYESDQAAREAEQGLLGEDYGWSAFRAEEQQRVLDKTGEPG